MKRVEAEGLDPYLFNYIQCSEIIGMDEHPTKAFKNKQNSTIAKGFQLLKKGVTVPKQINRSLEHAID